MKVNFAPLKGALKINTGIGFSKFLFGGFCTSFEDVILAENCNFAACWNTVLLRAACQFCRVLRANFTACRLPILPPTLSPIYVQAILRKAGASVLGAGCSVLGARCSVLGALVLWCFGALVLWCFGARCFGALVLGAGYFLE